MRCIILTIGLCACVVLVPLDGAVGQGDRAESRKTAQADLKKLQGTWDRVLMEHEGEELPAEDNKGWTAVYEDDVVTLKTGADVYRRGIITLDPTKKPKSINTWDLGGPYADQTVPGIYELDGDVLKLCFARPGAERPKEFTSKRGNGFLYCVYKRQKP